MDCALIYESRVYRYATAEKMYLTLLPPPSAFSIKYCVHPTPSLHHAQKKTVFFQKSRLKRIFFDFGSDRKTSYWRIVTQHQRSMGNRQIVVEICAETWSWAVWRSVGRSLEQYDAGRH